MKEVRRGADKAEIFSIAFNPSSTWMCVSSDKGTVHVYGIPPAVEPTYALLSLSFFSALLRLCSPSPFPSPLLSTPCLLPALFSLLSAFSLLHYSMRSLLSQSRRNTDSPLKVRLQPSAYACAPLTSRCSFSFMKGVLPSYFSSEWSFAQFHLPEARCIVSFAGERNVVIGVC